MLNLSSAALVLFKIFLTPSKENALKIIILVAICTEQQQNLLGLKSVICVVGEPLQEYCSIFLGLFSENENWLFEI